jgi:hypothetical protein
VRRPAREKSSTPRILSIRVRRRISPRRRNFQHLSAALADRGKLPLVEAVSAEQTTPASLAAARVPPVATPPAEKGDEFPPLQLIELHAPPRLATTPQYIATNSVRSSATLPQAALARMKPRQLGSRYRVGCSRQIKRKVPEFAIRLRFPRCPQKIEAAPATFLLLPIRGVGERQPTPAARQCLA